MTVTGALTAMAVTAAAGQSPPDTVRYRELTESEVRVETPQGEVEFQAGHDALLAVVFVTPDSMEAWYESLAIRSTGPDGTVEPETGDFLGRRFVLRYDAAGRVQTMTSPAFPEDVARVTDLSLQFQDFFPHRPAAPLEPGLAWSDTVVAVTGEEGAETRMESVARYTVSGDTLVAAERLLVVRSTVTISVQGNAPTEQDPRVTVSTSLDGVEENVFLVREGDGRLLERTRSAELRGTMAYQGMRSPVEFPVQRSYVNRIQLLR